MIKEELHTAYWLLQTVLFSFTKSLGSFGGWSVFLKAVNAFMYCLF